MKWVVFCALFFVGISSAQMGASLDIRLRSEHGEHLSAAALTLWPGGRQSLAANGTASFDELSAGHYRLEVQAEGFVSADTTFDLAAGERRTLLLNLHPLVMTAPEVVISENRISLPQCVYTREEIRSSSARSLSEFLSQTAGLELQSDGSPGANQTVRIGGSNTNQVMVLVDGRKVQSAGSGETDLSSIPLDWIESVSVHRGSATNLSGEAIGGIIDISTRGAAKPTEFSTEGELCPTYGRAAFLRTGQIGPLFSLMSLVRTQGPGDFPYRISEDDGVGSSTVGIGNTFRRQNNDVLRDQWLAKVTSPIGSQGTVEVTGAMDRLSRGMPGYLAPQLTPHARQTSRQEVLNARLHVRRNASALSARVSYDHASRIYNDSDEFSLIRAADENSAREQASVRGETEIRRVLVSGGAEAEREGMRSAEITGGKAERTRTALWTTASVPLWMSPQNHTTFSVQPGLRGERFGASNVLLPKLDGDAEYHASFRAGIHLSVGESYRAPTLYSLFWMDDEAARGNPDLKPEISQEFVGRAFVETAAKNALRAEINVSVQQVRDLIYWQRTFDNRWMPHNLQRANVRTLDASLEQLFFGGVFSVAAGANWTEARDATDDRNTGGKYLIFRAPRSQRVQLSYRDYGFSLQGSARWVSARPALATNSKWLRAYQLVDVSASYLFHLHLVTIEPSLGVNNLSDEDYRIVRFAPMPLREWHLGVRFVEP